MSGFVAFDWVMAAKAREILQPDYPGRLSLPTIPDHPGMSEGQKVFVNLQYVYVASELLAQAREQIRSASPSTISTISISDDSRRAPALTDRRLRPSSLPRRPGWRPCRQLCYARHLVSWCRPPRPGHSSDRHYPWLSQHAGFLFARNFADWTNLMPQVRARWRIFRPTPPHLASAINSP